MEGIGIKSILFLILVLIVIYAMSSKYFRQKKQMKKINSWIDDKQDGKEKQGMKK
jgi:preprotein translocase subunit YajC